MDHPVTVGAYERQVTQLGLVTGTQFTHRDRVVTFYESLAKGPADRVKIESARFT